MKHPSDPIEMCHSLRTEAENMLSSLSPKELTAQPAEVLLHELLVHKFELEMQNDELRRHKSPPSRIVTLSAIAGTA